MRSLSTLALSALALVSLTAVAAPVSAVSTAVCEAQQLPFPIPDRIGTDVELIDYVDTKSALHCLQAVNVDSTYCRCWSRGWYPDGL